MLKTFLFVLVFLSQLLFAQRDNYLEITNIDIDRDDKFIRYLESEKMVIYRSKKKRKYQKSTSTPPKRNSQ